MIICTFFRGMIKTRRFLRLWAFSWAIAHSFGVPGWFTRSMTLNTCWEVWPKTHHFCVYGRFRELLSTVLRFRGDL
jgi:hypothetical protein